MTTTTMIHASGQNTQAGPTFEDDLASWVARADIVTGTEAQRRDNPAVFDTATRDYYRDPNQECFVSWDVRVWELISADAPVLSQKTYFRDKAHGGKPYPLFRAARVRLRHRETGVRHTVFATHLPTWKATARRDEVWTDATSGDDGLEQLVINEKKTAYVTVAADWNAGWRVAADQKKMRDAMADAGLTWAWQGHVRTSITRTLIDGFATTLPVVSADLLPAVKSSDHAPIIAVFTIPTPPKETPVATSQNGYTANNRALVSSRLVPGTTRKLTVRNGAPGDLLLRFAGEFDKQVEDIDAARAALDDWGYAERPIRGSATELSNHASGTAIDLNATRHPLGKVNTFSGTQKKKIHTLLEQYEGCIRWGGDYSGRKDEMHFEIVKSVAECERILAKLNTPARIYPPGARDLKVGSRGEDVKFVQRKVGAGVDGVYGEKTKAAVKAWETRYNKGRKTGVLLADGVVGTGTWRAFGITPTYGKK